MLKLVFIQAEQDRKEKTQRTRPLHTCTGQIKQKAIEIEIYACTYLNSKASTDQLGYVQLNSESITANPSQTTKQRKRRTASKFGIKSSAIQRNTHNRSFFGNNFNSTNLLLLHPYASIQPKCHSLNRFQLSSHFVRAILMYPCWFDFLVFPFVVFSSSHRSSSKRFGLWHGIFTSFSQSV